MLWPMFRPSRELLGPDASDYIVGCNILGEQLDYIVQSSLVHSVMFSGSVTDNYILLSHF